MIDVDVLLSWGATYRTLDAGEMIFSEGSQCNFYYQLVSGQVKWFNINDEGKEYLQMLIEPGECFGELPLFDGEPYAASAIATTPAVVLRLHMPTFHQLLQEQPAILQRFTTLLAQRVRFKFFLIKEMANNCPENRIAALMKYIRQNKKNICCECNQVKLTRQQIADMTGLRVETVIRAMRNMHERKELFIEKGKVYLDDMTTVIPRRCKE
ncbi:MAG: hypothetical protein RLY16_1713 [Bacteroidota bacterium]